MVSSKTLASVGPRKPKHFSVSNIKREKKVTLANRISFAKSRLNRIQRANIYFNWQNFYLADSDT